MVKDMSHGSEAKLILFFTVPMFVGNVFQQLYNMVDAVVVGRYIGRSALAAVGTSFPVMFLLISFVMGLTMGVSVLISQLFGAQEMEKLKRAVSTTLIFLTACAVVLTFVGLFAGRWLLTLLATPPEVLDMAAAYLNIIFAGIIFTFAYNAFSGILRGLGDSKTPLYFLIIASLLNVVLDILFVTTFKMGVSGAAYATVISQAVASILCAIYVYKRIEILRLKRKDWVFDRDLFKKAVKLGIPASFQQTILSIGFMAVQSLVNRFGDITMAAYTAASRVDSIAMMPIMNFGLAISTFTGQNMGANRLDRVHRGYITTLGMTAIACILATIVIIPFGPYLIGIFVDKGETAVIAQGTEYITVVSYFYILMGLMFVTNGLLRGAGDMIPSLFSTALALGIRVAAAWWLCRIPSIGYRGIWFSIPIGWFFGLGIALIRYYSGSWKKKAIVRRQVADIQIEA